MNCPYFGFLATIDGKINAVANSAQFICQLDMKLAGNLSYITK